MLLKGSLGLTLIELLVVIAVLGVLMGLVVAVLDPAHFQNKTQDTRRISDLTTIQSLLELDFADNDQYPNNLSGFAGVPTDPDGGSYGYCPGTSNLSYEVCASLEVVDPATDPNIDCAAGTLTTGANCTTYNCCLKNPF